MQSVYIHNTYDSAITFRVNSFVLEDLVQGSAAEPQYLLVSGHRGHDSAKKAMQRAGHEVGQT